jgi:hypothetical protein
MCSIPHLQNNACLLARIDSARLAEGCLSGAICAAAVPRCSCQVNIEAMNKHLAGNTHASALAPSLCASATMPTGRARRGALGQKASCACCFRPPRLS